VFGPEFQALQREAEARQLGAHLHRAASATSDGTVKAVSAVLQAVASQSGGHLADLLADGFARSMMADSAVTHYITEGSQDGLLGAHNAEP
jgi:hypothetical protein